MTQADKFKQAVSQNKEKQAARENRGGGFTKIIYAPLYEGKNRAFRFTGLPYSVRENPTDCKRIFATMIVGDDDKKKFFVVPDPETNKSFLVHRIISKVLSYTWNPDGVNPQTGKKGIREYNYAKTHPSIFNMVFKNGNPNQQYDRGWQFSPVILVNVIDRHDMPWHRENKKLKVLSKKVSETAAGTLWYERGFPEVLYSTVMDDIVAAFGDWEGYDIVVRKTSSQPFYKAFHGENDAARFGDDAELLSVISRTAMTEEEKSWEGWDFDALYGVTPYLKWQKELGDGIRRIDKSLKTDFYDELSELVAKEEDEKTAEKDRGEGTSGATGAANADVQEPEDDPGPETEGEETVPETTKEPARPVAPAAETGTRVRQASGGTATASSVNVEALLKDREKFKGAEMLTAEEKTWITGVDAKGYLTWSPAAGDLIRDAENKEHLIPEKVHCNPYTGRPYDKVA